MNFDKDYKPVHLAHTVWMCATLAGVGAVVPSCADTENRFIPAVLSAGAGANGRSDGTSEPEGDSANPSVPQMQITAKPGPSKPVTQGPAAGMALKTDAESPAAAPAAAPPGATMTGLPSTPSAAASTDLDGGVDPLDTTACSAELAGCVLLHGADVSPCLDRFSKCRGVIASMPDGGMEAACSLQLTACILDNPANGPACDEEYKRCTNP